MFHQRLKTTPTWAFHNRREQDTHRKFFPNNFDMANSTMPVSGFYRYPPALFAEIVLLPKERSLTFT
ncbi:MAG: hypothetical protein EA381_04560 [Planctomycetaceae bacterium]|nr:MAG: hypothetical protein EA381_04560 [Planctomycetaceae bacterium]